MMTKQKWLEVFQSAGIDEGMQRRFHQEFEKRYPAEHQAFLDYLQIPAAESAQIREKAKK